MDKKKVISIFPLCRNVFCLFCFVGKGRVASCRYIWCDDNSTLTADSCEDRILELKK